MPKYIKFDDVMQVLKEMPSFDGARAEKALKVLPGLNIPENVAITICDGEVCEIKGIMLDERSKRANRSFIF